MSKAKGDATGSDAPALSGATCALVDTKIFHMLRAKVKRDSLRVPIGAVASLK